MRTSVCAACMSLVVVSLLSAQEADTAPTVKMGLNFTALVNDQLHQALDDTHANLVKLLAKQHAIATNCDGIEVDQDATGAVFSKAVENITSLPEAEQDAAYDTVMMGFAAQLGGQFAIAGYVCDAFCAHGLE